MSDLMKVGSDWGNAGTFKPLTSGISGAQRTQDAHARYLDALLAGRVFKIQGTASAPTAYVGAAGGTPLGMVHNPTGSGKVAALLAIGIALRASASGANTTAGVVWSGPSVAPSANTSLPTSALSLATGGSACMAVVNAGATSSTALVVAMGLFNYYWATAAAAAGWNAFFDIGGLVTAIPGNQFAFGMTTVPTSVTFDWAMYWEEVPYLTQV